MLRFAVVISPSNGDRVLRARFDQNLTNTVG